MIFNDEDIFYTNIVYRSKTKQ